MFIYIFSALFISFVYIYIYKRVINYNKVQSKLYITITLHLNKFNLPIVLQVTSLGDHDDFQVLLKLRCILETDRNIKISRTIVLITS